MKSSTAIFQGLWSKGLSCNSTKQLFFLHCCEWLLRITINKSDQKIRQMKNQIIVHQILEKELKQLGL